MMNMEDGGIKSPNSEPAAMEPKAIFLSSPYLDISGRAIAPTAMIEAQGNAVTAAKTAHAIIVAIQSPPLKCPSQLLQEV